MRGSIDPEPEDFCIFICLNAALLGPPKPNSVLQSLVRICCTLFVCTFSNFLGGGGAGRSLPLKIEGGRVPLVPRDRRPGVEEYQRNCSLKSMALQMPSYSKYDM